MKRIINTSLLSTAIMFSLVSIANAQSLMPDFIQELLDDWNNTSATDKLSGFIRLALTLAFGVVILAAVAFSIMAAIKYIRSQGDAGQVEEANKAIKAIFQGVVAMFVGIIGVVIVFFIFDVALPDPNLPTVCVKYPESVACRACTEGTEATSGSGTRCIDSPCGTGATACVTDMMCDTYEKPSEFSSTVTECKTFDED